MSSEKMKTLRSDFLVHWTGKCISKDYTTLCDSERAAYVGRLHSMLGCGGCDNGLWMNDMKIELHSQYDAGKKVEFKRIAATCFTETKLSNIVDHTRRYGCLGFGFARQFVMERKGAPMLYVPGDRELEKGAKDNISPLLIGLLRVLDFLAKQTTEATPISDRHFNYLPRRNCAFAKFGGDIGLEQFLKRSGCGAISDLWSSELIFVGLRDAILSCLMFVKTMSDENCHRIFQLLDEAEWRIPYTDQMVETLYGDDMPGKHRIEKTGVERPRGRITFTQKDLKVLVFPDQKTHEQALDKSNAMGKDIVEWLFKDPANVPIIVTIEECLQF